MNHSPCHRKNARAERLAIEIHDDVYNESKQFNTPMRVDENNFTVHDVEECP